MYLVIKLGYHPVAITISKHEALEEAKEKAAELNEEDGWRDRYKVLHIWNCFFD